MVLTTIRDVPAVLLKKNIFRGNWELPKGRAFQLETLEQAVMRIVTRTTGIAVEVKQHIEEETDNQHIYYYLCEPYTVFDYSDWMSLAEGQRKLSLSSPLDRRMLALGVKLWYEE